MRILILGCGYLGRRVAARWRQQGHTLNALTRSPRRAAELAARGIRPLIGDITRPDTLAALPAVDLVLYAVGYDRGGGADRRAVVVDGLDNALTALAGKASRIVFVSTSGVYGQSAGETVDEMSACVPAGESGRLALEAEHLVRQHVRLQQDSQQLGAVILRMSGLYGPGRLLRRIDQLQAGEPIAGEPDAWLNLIHIDDAATACIAAACLLESPATTMQPVPTLLISDNLPVQRRDYYGYLSQLVGGPPATFDPAAPARIAGLGKRCANAAARQQLRLELAFPTYREGLTDAVRAAGASEL